MYFYEFMFCVLCMYIFTHCQKILIYRKGVTMYLSKLWNMFQNSKRRVTMVNKMCISYCETNKLNLAQFVAWFEYVRLFSYKLTAEVMRLRNGKVIGSSHLGDDFYRYMLWKWSSKYLFDFNNSFINVFMFRSFRKQARSEFLQKRETIDDMRSRISFLMEFLAQERIMNATV